MSVARLWGWLSLVCVETAVAGAPGAGCCGASFAAARSGQISCQSLGLSRCRVTSGTNASIWTQALIGTPRTFQLPIAPGVTRSCRASASRPPSAVSASSMAREALSSAFAVFTERDGNTSRVYRSTPPVVEWVSQSRLVKTVGERIRQAREAKTLSQAALAEVAGFSHQSAIGNLETRATGRGGRRITDIADALGVPVEWLLRGPDCDNADIPWKVPPGHSEPGGERHVAEPTQPYGTNPIVQEALELLKTMSIAGQNEAIHYLRYLARQHAFPPSADNSSTDGERHQLSIGKAAA